MYLRLCLLLMLILLLGCSPERITENPVNICKNDGKIIPRACEGRHQLIVSVYDGCEEKTQIVHCGQGKVCKDAECVDA